MATRFSNGLVPLSALVQLDCGRWTAPTSAARWYALREKVWRERGVWLVITDGPNAYRSLANQHKARDEMCALGNCLAAAYPGTSSHGGTWWRPGVGWVDAMAFDISNWWAVPWEYFKAACASVGLHAGLITPDMAGGVSEWHHIIDLDPWGAIPAGLGATPFGVVEDKLEEGEMRGFAIETKSSKVFYVYGINDAERVSQAEASALKAANGGDEDTFVRVSSSQAALIIKGVKRRRARWQAAVGGAAADAVQGDLDEILSEIEALGDVTLSRADLQAGLESSVAQIVQDGVVNGLTAEQVQAAATAGVKDGLDGLTVSSTVTAT